MKFIQAGDYGRDVEIWQRFLAQIWLLERDRAMPGSFDEATLEATRAYQEECGLEPTGIVDRELIRRADQRGLGLVETQMPWAPSLKGVVAAISAFVLTILITQCMVLPNSGQDMQGVQLPISPKLTPNAPQPRTCPSWLC
jgi:hypothetical protein